MYRPEIQSHDKAHLKTVTNLQNTKEICLQSAAALLVGLSVSFDFFLFAESLENLSRDMSATQASQSGWQLTRNLRHFLGTVPMKHFLPHLDW